MLHRLTTCANPIRFHFELFESKPSIKLNNIRILFPAKIHKSLLKIVRIYQTRIKEKGFTANSVGNTTIHVGEKILILEKFLEAEEF